jgi:GMP synthase (glutamine-hydrolysing)
MKRRSRVSRNARGYAGPVKPFLLLATRPEDEAADDEYAGFLEVTGLDRAELRRIRIEKAPMPPIAFDDISGIIIGGSPFNAGDAESAKSVVQRRVEADMHRLLRDVVARDFPLLGACYGIGLLSSGLPGGVVDRTFPEEAGPTRISLTADGAADPLFGQLTSEFDAFVGHKEACSRLPDGAVLLASSEACPVQAFRVGANVYATQFHPELSLSSILTRIRIYKHAGYFDPDDWDAVVARITGSNVTEPQRLTRAFVERFAKE